MRKGVWILGLTLLVTGCIRPHYERPDVDVPCEWRLPANEGSTLCNAGWWEQFNDPVLNCYIMTALENNQDLKVAIARVFEYYAKLGVTSAALYPFITGNAQYTRTESSIAEPAFLLPGTSRTNDNWVAFFNLSWELDFWGRVRSATEASYAELLGQVEARRAVVMTVVTSVADAYITLRQLDAQLQISKNTVKARIESLKLAKSRFELGETSELEVKQAEAEYEVAAIRALEFEKAIPIQENQLSILLGENPHAIERGLSIEAFQYPLAIPAGLPSDLLERRPDIKEAEDQLIAANARITEAKALLFPQMTLTGMYGSESDTLKKFLISPAEMWQYGLNAVQTIFDAGRTVYLVDAAVALKDEALHNYLQTILNAFQEVDSALVTCEMNQKLVTENEKQVKILGEYYHLAVLRYNEGEVDYLNVLDAERLLFDAQLQLAQAQADNFTAVVELYKALGGGWVIDADQIAIDNLDCDDT